MIEYTCPNCGAQMSSPDSLAGKAETCPSCGNVARVPGIGLIETTASPPSPTSTPTARSGGSSYRPRHAGLVVSTERTSKRLKLHQALAVLAMIGGIILIVANWAPDDEVAYRGFAIGFGLVLFGFAWWLLTKIRIWWRHG